MSMNAGNLLWNRKRLALNGSGTNGGVTDVDTGLTQVQQAFGDSSVNEPPLGIIGSGPPPAGTPPASRVMVIPMLPQSQWVGITQSEPWVDSVTGRVMVRFTNPGVSALAPVCLFWIPDTKIGPGQADTYNPLQIG